jgi:hypothetical protein
MIGKRNGRHLILFRGANEISDITSPIEERVMCVIMKMDKLRLRHASVWVIEFLGKQTGKTVQKKRRQRTTAEPSEMLPKLMH